MNGECNTRVTTKNFVNPGEVYLTFIFDDIDSSSMGVFSISGGTYSTNIIPSFSDSTTTVDGYNGRYYFNTTTTDKIFNITAFIDGLTLGELDSVRAWLKQDKIGKLILPESPYRYYWVKLASIDNLGNIPLVLQETGEVIYTGTFNLSFMTIGQPVGYGMFYYSDDAEFYEYSDIINVVPSDLTQYGMFKKQDSLPMDLTLTQGSYNGSIYNPGTYSARPKLKITITKALQPGPIYVMQNDAYLGIFNNTLGLYTRVDLSNLAQGSVLDFDFSKNEFYVNGELSTSRLSGDLLEISSRNVVESVNNGVFSIDSFGYLVITFDELIRKVRASDINKTVFFENISNTGSTYGMGGRVLSIDAVLNAMTIDLKPGTIIIPETKIYITKLDDIVYGVQIGPSDEIELSFDILPRYI